mgnify:CR=1 FL=1
MLWVEKRSPSSRRAWIEIPRNTLHEVRILVALLAEGVDRNSSAAEYADCVEGVALLAEGVDRNSTACRCALMSCRSPSSRRAWIEIMVRILMGKSMYVALLAEGVDRNYPPLGGPVRRRVALLAEGVDRNLSAFLTA